MLNIELLNGPATPLLGIYPRELKICPCKTLYMNIPSNIFHLSELEYNLTLTGVFCYLTNEINQRPLMLKPLGKMLIGG